MQFFQQMQPVAVWQMQIQQYQVIGVARDLFHGFAGGTRVIEGDTLAETVESQCQAVQVDLVIIDQQQAGIGGQGSYGHAGFLTVASSDRMSL